MSDDRPVPETADDDAAPNAVGTGAINVADPVQIRRARRRGKRLVDESAEFWKRVFADKIGRREMWGLLASGGAFEQRYGTTANGSSEPIETQRQEGEQRLAFRLYLSWMKLDPEGVALMLQENHPQIAAASAVRPTRSY
ncbi:MAG TPA: hypothetical protein VKS24_24955 [Bradyrhizobium sp.]|nr:hypothetical protein [Bradyrhizobium sp.]